MCRSTESSKEKGISRIALAAVWTLARTCFAGTMRAEETGQARTLRGDLIDCIRWALPVMEE